MIELESPRLDAAFWRRFVEEFWERTPCVLRGVTGAALATDDELRQALMRAHRQGARSDASMRLYRGTAMEHGQRDAAFPGPRDPDLRAWGSRLRRDGAGEGVLLVLNALQRFSRDIWYRARDFLAPFLEVGSAAGVLAGERIDVDAFVGWYDQTPEGVHKDAASNFMFVVHGPKRMRLWPADAFVDPDDRRDEFHAREAAAARVAGTTVEVEPGDVLYWPSNAWHVGTSEAGLTACINLPLYARPEPHADVLAALAELLAEGVSAPRPVAGAEDASARVDAQIERLRTALAGDGSDPESPDVHARALDRQLRRHSAGGFDRVPPALDPVPLGPGMTVARRARCPLLWSRIRGGELLCAGNGHSLVLPEHPAIVALLRRLDGGHRLPVESQIDHTVRALGDAADEDTAAVLRSVLQAFVAWDVLAVEGQSLPEPKPGS